MQDPTSFFHQHAERIKELQQKAKTLIAKGRALLEKKEKIDADQTLQQIH